MKRILRIFLLLIMICGCSKSEPEKELLSPEISTVQVCAKVNSIGHIFPLPGRLSRLRWFVDLTITSALSNIENSAPKKGETFQFSIHSPSRDFGDSPKDSQDKIFLIELLQQEDGWRLLNAKQDNELCPNQGL